MISPNSPESAYSEIWVNSQVIVETKFSGGIESFLQDVNSNITNNILMLFFIVLFFLVLTLTYVQANKLGYFSIVRLGYTAQKGVQPNFFAKVVHPSDFFYYKIMLQNIL